MSRKNKKIGWKVMTESIYRFGKEERVQSAYEKILPIEKEKAKGDRRREGKGGQANNSKEFHISSQSI